MNGIFQIISALTLLFVSVFFGYISKPTEMGLAILAGALGLAFSNLDKFSEFSGAGFSAKMKEQVQAVIDKETEISTKTKSNLRGVSDQEKSILTALADPKYTWRTLSGLSSAAGHNESEAWKLLASLAEKGLVRSGNKNKTDEMIWTLTQMGRQQIT